MRPAWVTSGIAQLIRQFCDQGGNAGWIGVASLDGLDGSPSGLYRQGGRFQTSPDLPITDGFIWQPDSPAEQPELWLSPSKTNYRAIFERFAQRYLGAAGLSGADVQIDHVFPKKAAVLGHFAYVRMLAIPPESNMAAGRTLETSMVRRNDALGARRKRTRMATYFSIGKASGFTDYERLPDDGRTPINATLAAALIAHLRRFGLPGDVLTDLDRDLLTQTAGRLR